MHYISEYIPLFYLLYVSNLPDFINDTVNILNGKISKVIRSDIQAKANKAMRFHCISHCG